jgi:hypothetical protein
MVTGKFIGARLRKLPSFQELSKMSEYWCQYLSATGEVSDIWTSAQNMKQHFNSKRCLPLFWSGLRSKTPGGKRIHANWPPATTQSFSPFEYFSWWEQLLPSPHLTPGPFYFWTPCGMARRYVPVVKQWFWCFYPLKGQIFAFFYSSSDRANCVQAKKKRKKEEGRIYWIDSKFDLSGTYCCVMFHAANKKYASVCLGFQFDLLKSK